MGSAYLDVIEHGEFENVDAKPPTLSLQPKHKITTYETMPSTEKQFNQHES